MEMLTLPCLYMSLQKHSTVTHQALVLILTTKVALKEIQKNENNINPPPTLSPPSGVSTMRRSFVTPLGDIDINVDEDDDDNVQDEQEDDGDSTEALAQIGSQMMQKNVNVNSNGGNIKNINNINNLDEKQDVLDNDPQFRVTTM